MSGVQPIRPAVGKTDDGRISVYIAGLHKALPHEAALSLFQQLGMVLGLPTSEGVARFAAQILESHRNDGCPGDVDGDDVQEWALENELLEVFERGRDVCGAHCECEQGDRCYRHSALGSALVRLLDSEPTVREVQL